MWRTGGRSSALDRAQRLLSSKRSGGGPGGPGGPGDSQESVGRSVTSRPAGPSFSDLSQESSVSVAAEPEAPHAEEPRAAEVCVGRSRFLKKPSPPTSSGRSQEHPEPSRESWSQRPSQTAALSRLSVIESRVRVRKQTPDQARRGMKADQSTAASSGDSPRGNRATGGVWFRTAEPPISWMPDAERPLTTVSGSVSLESDEEDMRKLLRDSPVSSDVSRSSGPEQSCSVEKRKMSGRRRVDATPLPPPLPPPAPQRPSPPHTPESPHRPRRASPFRFAGQAQARFSPSALSPPPSPCPAERPGSSSSSSSSCFSSSSTECGEVLSLEELFPAKSHCEETQSVVSSVSSRDFKINVRSLHELLPAAFRLTEESARSQAGSDGVQRGTKQTVTASPDGNQQLERDEEEEEEEEEDWEEKDYLSDFESESRLDQSASQVSEDLQGQGGLEEEEVSELGSEDSNTSRTKISHYSSVSSGSGRAAGSGRESSERVRRSAATRMTLKEAAVQTQADYVEHTLWPAPGTFSPALFALNEKLKQQLVVMRRSIQSRQQRHARLLQSLEPPGYRYTTLEDTQLMMERRRVEEA